VRLGLVPAPDPAATDRPLLRIVQGNVDQHMKWSAEARQEIFTRYLNLSQAPSARPLAAVIWPETATPYLIDTMPENAAAVARAAPRGGILLTGAMRVREGAAGLSEEFQAWNSLVALDETGAVLGTYDKAHLVPFGEFIPPAFRWFTDLMHIPLGDFQRGALGQASFAVQGQRLAANVCYEDLFGEELATRFGESALAPTVFVNVSNLGWFGDTVAIDQHLNISRMRALEFQRPFVRATNTGATVILNHQGQVQASMPRFTAGALVGQVQGHEGLTPFAWWASRWGLWPLWLVALAVLALARRSRRRAV
jgi:apolipoprotein N-acyltransferase